MPYQAVLDFWFSDTTRPFWFAKSDAFDTQLRTQFGDVLVRATQGELFEWRATLEGRVAEIIVLDQFSRNLYRNTPQAFAQDLAAICLAQEVVIHADFDTLPLEYRRFALMPFMHSESLAIHNWALPYFEALNLPKVLDYEHQHRRIIQQFGRYPHRNIILQRVSTEAELEFLQQHSGF